MPASGDATALALRLLAFLGCELAEEIVEGPIAAVVPVKLHVVARAASRPWPSPPDPHRRRIIHGWRSRRTRQGELSEWP